MLIKRRKITQIQYCRRRLYQGRRYSLPEKINTYASAHISQFTRLHKQLQFCTFEPYQRNEGMHNINFCAIFVLKLQSDPFGFASATVITPTATTTTTATAATSTDATTTATTATITTATAGTCTTTAATTTTTVAANTATTTTTTATGTTTAATTTTTGAATTATAANTATDWYYRYCCYYCCYYCYYYYCCYTGTGTTATTTTTTVAANTATTTTTAATDTGTTTAATTAGAATTATAANTATDWYYRYCCYYCCYYCYYYYYYCCYTGTTATTTTTDSGTTTAAATTTNATAATTTTTISAILLQELLDVCVQFPDLFCGSIKYSQQSFSYISTEVNRCQLSYLGEQGNIKNIERIPNLTGEQSDGITVFRIPPMTSLMLHRCRTGAISLQSAEISQNFARVAQITTYTVAMTAIDPSSSFVPIPLQRDVIVVHRSGILRYHMRKTVMSKQEHFSDLDVVRGQQALRDSYTSLMYLFKVSKQLITRIVPEVCTAIIEELEDFIKLNIFPIASQTSRFLTLLVFRHLIGEIELSAAFCYELQASGKSRPQRIPTSFEVPTSDGSLPKANQTIGLPLLRRTHVPISISECIFLICMLWVDITARLEKPTYYGRNDHDFKIKCRKQKTDVGLDHDRRCEPLPTPLPRVRYAARIYF
ncbi:hypothetical protein ANN_21936 [Periplaneta americana]|uniref:Uncharacterized protein n=1 Tax=Periplaneta americana TaxID=6978 RepID=A0ABQ8S6R6_PERAM|nr:hypothetical protein ANN_21936 [Periplaneta americana]